jgi:hypothetical protein
MSVVLCNLQIVVGGCSRLLHITEKSIVWADKLVGPAGLEPATKRL